MINKPSLNAVRVSLTGLIVTFLAHGVANAGLVRGTWDPGFGPALPGLSWTARADLLVPNGCSFQADGVYGNTGACAGSVVLGVFLRLYNTGYAGSINWDNLATYSPDPNQAQSFAECNFAASGDPYYVARCPSFFGSGNDYYGVTNLRVVSGNIVGFDSFVPFGLTYDTSLGNPSGALGNGFSLNFTVNGPVFQCVGNPPTPQCNGPVAASTTDLTQFLVTYLSTEGSQPSDTSTPKFTDSNGNALGAVLDGNGNYLGQAPAPAVVPEPGTLALGLAALTAIGWWRRRRA